MLAIIIALLTTCFLFLGVLWFGSRIPGYTHLRHTISELGETGSVLSTTVSWGLFAPVGISLLALAAILAGSPARGDIQQALILLAIAVGIGYFGAAIFPCDRGSPLSGSARQQLHNLMGGVEYIGGAVALFLASQSLPSAIHDWYVPLFFKWSAGVVGVVAILLSLPYVFPLRGLIQRIGELVLFANIVTLATIAYLFG